MQKKTENECSREVSKNLSGCFKVISETKKWDVVEVSSPEGDKHEGVCGVIMGEPEFIQFVNKAIIDYKGNLAITKIMKEMIIKSDKPTRH